MSSIICCQMLSYQHHLKDAMKKVVGKPHPYIYEIIDVFKREEASTKMKMQMLEAGAHRPQDEDG